MIIARKYEWLGILYEQDPNSKKLIDEAFEIIKTSQKKKKWLMDYNKTNIPAFLNIGCGIPGETYRYFMVGFEELDKTNPYDNGLTFNDVTSIEFETSRKGTAIQMRFVNQVLDSPYRIVGFAAVENKDGSVRKNKGWEMIPPFEVG